MRLIDADMLSPDRDYYDNSICSGYDAVSCQQIDSATPVQAIPLAKVKQAREEIENINPVYSTIGDRIPVLKNCDDIKAEVLAIMDKLIAESGGE